MLVYLTVIFDLRCKMNFLDFGVNFLFPHVANDIMKMIDKELHYLFNEYSSNAEIIQLFEVSSKGAFSTGGCVFDSFRSSLTPLMVNVLVCTQDWLWKSNDSINFEDYVNELQTMKDGQLDFNLIGFFNSLPNWANSCMPNDPHLHNRPPSYAFGVTDIEQRPITIEHNNSNS
ncbi:hypothetical protein J1N35_007991 [Gossypium stocksii]|uniref:HAT C-terminal dimerisation domain-containing protein n=1 Tax=Gossypium stocksii TaxID=47602 RepID=A0A9D4AG36_9ROSI|nr:hypothetical protein J1N35_007991 [Gossypium stocksii]